MEDIFFNSDFSQSSQESFLIELTPELSQEIAAGRQLFIKGSPDEDAVLCSSERTYLLRSNETSNSLLVLKEGKIQQMTSYVHVLEPTVPVLDPVYELLRSSKYMLGEENGKFYTYEELLQKCQASKSELDSFLNRVEAFEFNGFVRIFDEATRVKIIGKVLKLIIEYNLEVVYVYYLLEKLNRVPPEILRFALVSAGSFATAIGQEIWEPDLFKIHQLLAIKLFLLFQTRYCDEFEQLFFSLVKSKLPPKFRLNVSVDEVVKSFSIKWVYNTRDAYKYEPYLPLDLQKRINHLFNIKAKYTQQELEFYLTEVINIPLQRVLMKYTKRIMEHGKDYYIHKLVNLS